MNLFFMHNFILQILKCKHLINEKTIDIWFSKNFASMKDIKRKYNSIIDLSKFTLCGNKILNGVVQKKISYQKINFYIWSILVQLMSVPRVKTFPILFLCVIDINDLF